jgi:hypothetical protein
MAKVSEELLNSIKEVQSDMGKIQNELGAILLMELRKSTLLDAYKQQEAKMEDARKAILEAHGDGTVDLNTGEFTPAEAPEAEIVE